MGRTSVQVGTVPPATAQQGGGVNNDVDAETRSGVVESEMAEGPQMGERGEFKSATYEVVPGIFRTDN